MKISRALLLLILAGTTVRLLLGWGIGLGIDESYMVTAGRGAFRLGYFDHPAISWWLSDGIARLTGSEAAIVVRLPFIALFALSTWLMFRLTAAIFTEAAGLWAAIAFNLAPVFGITSGGWVLPDGPLVAALLGAAFCLVRALPRPGWGWWLGAGLCAGLALMSKYTGVLTLAGAVLYLVTQKDHRHWLARPQPYAASLVALLVFSPVILWNARNGWASLAFQGGRAAAARLNLFGPLITFAGEALFLLPWIWAGLMLVWLRQLRAGPADRAGWLLACLAAPPILLFAVVSLWSRQVLFHWAAPGYLMLFPLLGAWLATTTWAPRATRWTLGCLAVLLLLVVSEVRLAWLPLSNDPALQARDWTGLRPTLAERGLLALPIAGTNWSDTGKIGIGLGRNIPVFCLNADSREFRFAATPPPGSDVLIIAPRRSPAQMQAAYGGSFVTIETMPGIRLGKTDIPIYLGRGLKSWP